MSRDAFASCHPVVNVVYFTAVLGFSMFFLHPLLQLFALAAAVTYSLLLRGARAAKFNLLYLLPLLLVMAAANPIFNHAGVTILFYLKNGNPITLESVLYGIASAFMYITVIIWFSCFNAVMSSDKLVFLLGRAAPALSLVLAMTLRFVPRYAHQIKVISQAQRCIGRDVTQGSMIQRARNGLRILSIITSWAMESAIDTSDSMKSRGYGLPNRTSFTLVRFDRRDQLLLAVMLLLIGLVLAGAATGANSVRYFPSIHACAVSALGIAGYIACFLLYMLPIILAIVEEVRWNSIVSRM
ncbi:energy-coupling factor transporter transmembrane component T [Paenibacillus sp. OV219]|uniref:energy-coupling factor transporter transmembrane component T n=1 Tax=Paenibacillus sp. OV219 TaxID=1884377 RepID=UPI0008CF3086|nr:energy-coupling factor transporter transmembrane component T [Paenibacillus sp. OV219]SEM51843.1 energy-coupling factor transport system permease protein [Paenibacillus sp. OV219]